MQESFPPGTNSGSRKSDVENQGPQIWFYKVGLKNMTASVRKIQSGDEKCWRELWDAYTRFYEREPIEAVTRRTWARIMEADSPLRAIVAEDESRDVIGMADYIIHENTSTLAPACYLADLIVDPGKRGMGVGRLMIDWLVAEMKTQGWSRLYCHTKESNYRARALYDTYTQHSGFLRYVITNPSA
jgi:ribosomal protein S18 acetylase RimI-like enzyme